VQFKLKEPKQTSIKEWALPGVVVMLPEEEKGKEVPTTSTTTTTTAVVEMLPEECKEVSVLVAATTITATKEGRKRKAEVLAEGSKKKFVFNKRGKLNVDEMKELSRTNKNIFSWLKPTPAPMLKVAKVVEMECQEEDREHGRGQHCAGGEAGEGQAKAAGVGMQDVVQGVGHGDGGQVGG
jgi:hypothetical protein